MKHKIQNKPTITVVTTRYVQKGVKIRSFTYEHRTITIKRNEQSLVSNDWHQSIDTTCHPLYSVHCSNRHPIHTPHPVTSSSAHCGNRPASTRISGRCCCSQPPSARPNRLHSSCHSNRRHSWPGNNSFHLVHVWSAKQSTLAAGQDHPVAPNQTLRRHSREHLEVVGHRQMQM